MRVFDIVTEEKQIDEAPAGTLKQMGRRVGAKAAGAVGMKGTAAGLTGAADTGKEANDLKVALKGYLGKTGKNIKQLDAADLAAFLKSKSYPTTAIKATGVLPPKQIDDLILKTVQAKHTAAGGASSASGGGSAKATGGTDGGGGEPNAAQRFLNKAGEKVGAKPTDANNDGKDDATGEPMPEPGADAAASPSGGKVEFTPNQPVMFVDKTGQEKQATVVGKSQDGDENKVSVKGAKGQTFNIPRTSLKDPKTKKPFAPGAATKAEPAAGGLEIPAEMQKKIDSLNPEQKKELASLL